MPRHQAISVTKAEGRDEPFDERKLRDSMLRAGADDGLIDLVMREVGAKLREGATTEALRKIATQVLRREARHIAGRYDLKRALLSLGPSGYPFERFWGAMLVERGFSVALDVMLRGRCVEHEVDVVATRGDERRLAECKFHNRAGGRTDVKVALYCYARHLDLRERPERPPGREVFELVTNTRFTSDAVRYAKCVQVGLVGWDYPAGHSLRELIDRHGLYPITCLSTLDTKQRKVLVADGVVTCRALLDSPEPLEALGLRTRQIDEALEEAAALSRIAQVVRDAEAELEG